MKNRLPYIAPQNRQADQLFARLPRDSLGHVASFFRDLAQAIALRVELHSKTVNKIIRRELRLAKTF